MKVLGLAADEGGCGFYRMRAPAEELRLLGTDIEISQDGGVDAVVVHQTDGTMRVEEIRTDADLIVIQRPLSSVYYSLIQQAKRQGIATIVELDDDFSTVHGLNIAHEALYVKEDHGPQWIEAAASIADHVTVSTPQLAKFARHGRYSVLRNCVPDSIFKTDTPKSSQSWPRIGWSGTVQTHPNDLQQTKGRVAEVLKTNGLSLNVVGDGTYVARNLGLYDETEIFATGWVPLDMYYQYLQSFLDIGIVPLELSPFNQAKSYLKGLEFGALGIPFVASATREYELLEVNGIGKTAKSPGDWAKHLQRMIDRPAETERIAKESRDRIEAEHTYSVHAPKWIDAWEKAINYRKTHNE